MIENKTEVNWRLFWNTRKELVLGILFLVLSALILLIGVLRQIAPIIASLDELKARELELAKFYDKTEQLKQLAIDPNFNQSSDINKVLPSSFLGSNPLFIFSSSACFGVMFNFLAMYLPTVVLPACGLSPTIINKYFIIFSFESIIPIIKTSRALKPLLQNEAYGPVFFL